MTRLIVQQGIKRKIKAFLDPTPRTTPDAYIKPEAQCGVICILSHGNRDGILGTNRIVVDRKWITNKMTECDALKGKPKMIIYQACRGGEWLRNMFYLLRCLMGSINVLSPGLRNFTGKEYTTETDEVACDSADESADTSNLVICQPTTDGEL
jgi:hypothetical protein